MWDKIKSWFKKKKQPTPIDKYTTLLDRADQLKNKKSPEIICPFCQQKFDDFIELTKHGMEVHTKTFEEMKKVCEVLS